MDETRTHTSPTDTARALRRPHDVPLGAVVVGHDGSVHSERALRWAAEQAAIEARPLVVVHGVGVEKLLGRSWEGAATALLSSARAWGAAVVAEAAAVVASHRPAVAVSTLVCDDDARRVLLAVSQRASTVVVGARGRGPVTSLLLGSVSAAVVRQASCPVVVCRPHHDGLVGRGVVVGADGTPDAAPVLEHAYRLAAERGLPLTVVHAFAVLDPTIFHADVPATVGEVETARVALAESVAGLSERYPQVHVTRHLQHGLAEVVLASERRHWDVVVVGHHHRTTWERLWVASTALAVVERSDATVVVVPEGAPLAAARR